MSTFAAVFLIDGNKRAHEFGNKHPGYTFESTEKKFAEKQRAHETKNVGWPSCKAIQDAGSEHCKSCPHLPQGVAAQPGPTRGPHRSPARSCR